MFALSVANVCLVFGKCLPCLWQVFALSVANVCLVFGKCLPCLWQMFALYVANVCLVCGKCLPCLWQMFALSVANICLVCGKCSPCLWQMFPLSVPLSRIFSPTEIKPMIFRAQSKYIYTKSTTMSVPSSELGPTPSPASVWSPPQEPKGHTRLRVRGVGWSQFGQLCPNL